MTELKQQAYLLQSDSMALLLDPESPHELLGMNRKCICHSVIVILSILLVAPCVFAQATVAPEVQSQVKGIDRSVKGIEADPQSQNAAVSLERKQLSNPYSVWSPKRQNTLSSFGIPKESETEPKRLDDQIHTAKDENVKERRSKVKSHHIDVEDASIGTASSENSLHPTVDHFSRNRIRPTIGYSSAPSARNHPAQSYATRRRSETGMRPENSASTLLSLRKNTQSRIQYRHRYRSPKGEDSHRD